MSELITEMWAWYGLTVFVVTARIISRRLLFNSFKALKYDDYLMLFALVSYTGLLIVVHILSYTPTNLINPDDHITITPEEIPLREYGSKLVIITEECQMFTIWSVKACLLAICDRLTTSLSQNTLVKITMVYTACSFILMQILFLGVWCRPFYHYWQIPPDDLNCSAETNHMITNAVLNISSDIMIILLPMPIFIKSRLHIKKKVALCSVFAIGAFSILAAALSKYYSLGLPYGTEWIFWYIREVSTAMITANLPLTWTLLQRLFKVGPFHSDYGRSSGRRAGDTLGRPRSTYGNLSSASRNGRMSRKGSDQESDLGLTESQERITGGDGIQLKIYQRNEITITSEEIDADNQGLSSQEARVKAANGITNTAKASISL